MNLHVVGLCAARHLASQKNLIPVVYEQSSDIGGTWVYNNTNEDIYDLNAHTQGKSSLDIHSSMYKNMYTNLPKEVMKYPDFPFPPQTSRSFLHHTEVKKYLENYVKHFDLTRFIKFQTEVTNVKPILSEVGKTKWKVQTRNISNNTYETNEFDGVMVCNGHYSSPNSPEISGLHEYFKCLIVSDTRKGGQVTMGTISFQFCPVDPLLMIS